MIGFNSLEQLFAYANLLCTSVETKVQIEMQLDNWILDLSSINACNQSISKLKTLLIDTEQMDIQNPDIQLLYTLMIKRLKKERITKLAKNTLSLIEIDVRTETSAIALHSKILNVLHGLVNQNIQLKKGESKPSSKAITSTVSTDRVEPEEEGQSTPSEGGAKPKKPINKKRRMNQNPKKLQRQPRLHLQRRTQACLQIKLITVQVMKKVMTKIIVQDLLNH